MRIRPRAIIALMILPVVLGLVLSALWQVLGGGPTLYVRGPLTWLPALLGLGCALALSPALALAIALRRQDQQVRREIGLEQAASRRRFITRLDHELKNPLQGIRAALADEPSERQRRSIDAQSRRLISLLGDLRKIGELEHTALELTAVDPHALVAEAVQTVREAPGASERRLSVAMPTAPRPLPAIRGDEDLLFLALVNVLTNAVKYSVAGDAIEVRGRRTESEVVLEIADTGRGIAPEEMQSVWEELGRSREAHGIEGSGLGLPMVRAIIERHGGTATLQSWHGEGSTVTLRLPIAGPAG